MNLRGKFAHLANQSLECPYGGRSKDADDAAWDAWRSTGQERQTSADDTKSSEDASETRQLNGASK